MINEAYCSYEISKLLKEKGFRERICSYYKKGHKNPMYTTQFPSNWNEEMLHQDCISAPTHQMACAWLRGEKDIVIVIEPHTYDYPNEKTSSYVFAIWEGDNYIEIYSNSKLRGISYLTYEDAVESALKYSLENLL